MKLHDYQSDAISSIYHKWKTNRKIILWSMMGSGKSEMAAYIAQDCLKDGVPVLMIVRGRELVKNLSERLDRYQITHSVYMAKHIRYDPRKLIQVCSIDTMKSRAKWPYADKKCVVILDECHKSYDLIFDNYPIHWILGMSATPFGDMSKYEDYVQPLKPYELRDMGILVTDKIYCPHVIDTSSLKIVAGDFQKDQVEKLVTNGEIVGNVIKDYIELGEDRPAVCFAVSVEHSKQLRDEFIANGVTSVHCDAKSSDDERKKAHEDLINGRIKVICNVDIFSVGWDCPMVSCIILARPTWSLIWYLQAIGRGLRSYSGKHDCIILDNAGNVFRHGTAYRPREISLEKKDKKTKKQKDTIAVRTCFACYAVYDSKEEVCPYCGEKPPAREIKKVDGSLRLYNETEQESLERRLKEAQVAYWKLKWVAKSKGLTSNWIKEQLIKRYGKEVMPLIEQMISFSNR